MKTAADQRAAGDRPVIKSVYIMPNGLCAVFDTKGEQVDGDATRSVCRRRP